jgi:hypothetical protein
MWLAVRGHTRTRFTGGRGHIHFAQPNRAENPILIDTEETLQKGFRSIKSFGRHDCCCG